MVNTSMTRVLIAGCGDIGTCMADVTSDFKVYGLRRNVESVNNSSHIQWIQADLSNPASLMCLPEVEYLIYTATPDQRVESAYRETYYEGLKNIIVALNPSMLRRVFFVSSTSVYGQEDGSWVDEESPTPAKSFSGEILLEAERWLLQQSVPSTVVRFAGIYGPGRTYLIKKVLSGSVALQQIPPKYTNRIHRDDCAGILAHLIHLDLNQHLLEACYLGVDSNPVSEWEVCAWLADKIGAKTPEPMTVEKATQNKRCSNKRILNTGYKFKFPDYQSGYQDLIKEPSF